MNGEETKPLADLREFISRLTSITNGTHFRRQSLTRFTKSPTRSFDVGATTLVDFEPGGVGAELLRSIGMRTVRGEALPGYIAWLPDRVVTLYRNRALWEVERFRGLGDTPSHRLTSALLIAHAGQSEASGKLCEMPTKRPFLTILAAEVSGWQATRLGQA